MKKSNFARLLFSLQELPVPNLSLSAGKQEEFCYKTCGFGFALSGDIHLGCASQLLPKQPLHDVAMLTNIKGQIIRPGV